MTDGTGFNALTPSVGGTDSALVARSDVPAGLAYPKYRQYLRYDFFHSCAYCTMSEAEAQAIRFCIDHYESRKARPELENAYSNLMYSCDECNVRKGDRCPPASAREQDFRFYRPDQDVYRQHFERKDLLLAAKSNVGYYSIEALDLNRQSLRRLRNIRDRLTRCDRLIAEGVLGLRKFHIDQLPTSIKGQAARAIRQMDVMAEVLSEDIDHLLREYAKSELIDPDNDNETASAERAAKLKNLESLYPGSWRAPRAAGRR